MDATDVMTAKDRLERIAMVLDTTRDSPSLELHDMGLRLLDQELRLLAEDTRLEGERETEEYRSWVCSHPAVNPVSTICEESRARVREIMGRDQ